MKVKCVEVAPGYESQFSVGQICERELVPEGGFRGDLYLIGSWGVEQDGVTIRQSHGNELSRVIARFKEVGQ